MKIGIAAAGLAAALPLANASATQYIYAVTVTTNYGPQFNDCFSFKGAYLYIAGLAPRPLITTAAPTTPKTYYTSVATIPFVDLVGVNFAFAGSKTGNSQSGTMTAVGASSQRGSYIVTGTAVPSCPTEAKAGRNNWLRVAH
jgi:hypothetical protein